MTQVAVPLQSEPLAADTPHSDLDYDTPPDDPAVASEERAHWHCPTEGTMAVKNVDRWEKSTRIGELANAYGDDGTKSTFRYGQRADSGIETEVSASGKAKWVTLGAIVGHKVSNRRDGVVGEGPVGGRFQNQELSQFKYAETRRRSCGPAGKHHQRFVVHVVRWLGGETHPDSAGDAIGGCPKKHPYASNTISRHGTPMHRCGMAAYRFPSKDLASTLLREADGPTG